MSILKYFKNIPRSPAHRATGLKCNFFFFKFAMRSLEKKGPVARWGGDRGLSPSPRATAAGPGPQARQGACRPPAGDRGTHPYKRADPPLPSSFEPENFTKNPEKKERSEEKESGEALPDSALVISRLVYLVYILLYLSTTYLSRSNLSRGSNLI